MDTLVRRLHRPADGKTRLFFLGQAGFALISPQGKILVWDLCLSDYVQKENQGRQISKRLYPAPLTPEEVEPDVVICTHAHADHYDYDTVPGLAAKGAQLFVSRACGPLAEEQGISRADIVGPGDERECEGFRLSFIPCDHGTSAPDAFGFIVEVGGKRLAVVGDSSFHPEWAELYNAKGKLDALIYPINGNFGNLDWQESAALGHAVAPRLSVPSHMGLFAVHGGRMDLYCKAMDEQYPDDPYLIMTVGEEVEL